MEELRIYFSGMAWSVNSLEAHHRLTSCGNSQKITVHEASKIIYCLRAEKFNTGLEID